MTIEYKDSKRIVGTNADRIGTTGIQGYAGGSGVSAEPYPAGGGGGAGAAGGAGSGTTAGDGGDGLQSDITGTNTYYAGGGGGGVVRSGHTVGSGGLGGGANGAYGASHATYYGGGGGGSCDACATSGNGYQGIVILQFTTSGTSYSTTGSPTVDTSSVSGKTILKYTSSGSFILSSGTPDVRYLVVAGGGGGGAGGGGAGGFITGEKLALPSATYSITVGSGGTGGNGGGGNGNSGGNSVFSDITAIGGGYGGSGTKAGGDGGSGGGTNNSATAGSGSTYTITSPMDTNLQNNSLFIEKDVARRYWFSEATAPTFESDFSSSTGWTTVGSNISITGGVIQASSMATQSDNRIYYDLGSALSDQFVIDFDHYADSASSGGFWGMFALTDTTSIPKTDDSIHALIDMGSWNTYLRYSNEGSETNLALAGSLTTGQWQYIRFVRDGTTGTFYVYSDSDRTNQVLSATGTIPTTVTGLRYFQSGAILSGNSGTTTYKIDNLKVYDGVTSVSGDTWNMQPTLEDDFSTDNFVQTGTEIDVSGGELVWDANPDNTTTGGYIDFGENLSDTAWVCRFKVKVNNYSGAVTTATNFYIQFQNITTVNSTTSRDSMGIHLRLKSGSTDWRVEAVDGAVAGGGAGNLIDGSATTETIYVQMYRDGNTIYAEWYDNADYTGTPTNTANHSSGTPANLRYFAVYRRSDVATTGVSNGIIDDLEIYNGVTSIN